MNYDPTDAASMIRFLAAAGWPFKALRLPCPNNINRGVETLYHQTPTIPCICNGRGWVPEPNTKVACWEAQKVTTIEAWIAASEETEYMTKELATLYIACKWAEQQMGVKA